MSARGTHLHRHALVSISIVLLCASAFLLTQNGCGDGPHTPIQHVVIIFQENRTPDNLFHDPVLIARGADIVSSGINSKGQTIPLSQIDLGTNGSDPDHYDLSHSHTAFLRMCGFNQSTRTCAMDGADRVSAGCAPGFPPACRPLLSLST